MKHHARRKNHSAPVEGYDGWCAQPRVGATWTQTKRYVALILLSLSVAQAAKADSWGALATISSTEVGHVCNIVDVPGTATHDIDCPSINPFIDGSGNVGIGTTNLIYPNTGWDIALGVEGNTVFRNGRLAFDNGSAATHIQFFNGSTWEGNYSFNRSGTGQHQFYVHASGSPAMVVGNAVVGIGTTQPSETLHVIGNAEVSGTVQLSGTGTETCTATDEVGQLRINPSTGRLEICRL